MDETDDAYDLVVLHVDDLGLDHPIETGLQVAIDTERRQAILPFRDEMTAEEVSRIICGTLKREMDAS